jgi:hypothetical protein
MVKGGQVENSFSANLGNPSSAIKYCYTKLKTDFNMVLLI